MQDPIVGQWQGSDAEGKTVVLFLERDGRFEAVAKGERVKGTWTLDDQVEPNRFELNFEGKKVRSIARVQKNSLLIEPVDTEGKPPTEFTPNATHYTRQE